MSPPSKRRKIQSSTTSNIPLSSVLEWFDTTLKPDTILCRERERNTIESFLDSCLKNQRGGSYYVCGSPGIGKSLLLLNILEGMKKRYSKRIKITCLNAMTLQNNKSVYSALAELVLNEKLSWEKAKQTLESNLLSKNARKGTRKQIPLIICIDEIDRLLTKERSIVYDLFEWPYLTPNVLIVIGIANSVDLVEHALPLLNVRGNKPSTLVFPSYSEADLQNIVAQRIQLCNKALRSELVLFEDSALRLCVKKVAEMGDARRLLDVCKTALQAVYTEGIVSNAKTVTIATMSKTLFQFFRSDQTSHIECLPRLAQVLLACLCSLMVETDPEESKSKGAKQSVTPNKLRELYIEVHKKIVGGTRPNVAEFNVLLDQLVNCGICKIVESRRCQHMDRPIVMITAVGDLVEELKKDADLEKVIKKGSVLLVSLFYIQSLGK